MDRYQNIGKSAQNLASIMMSSKTKSTAPEYDIPAADKGPSGRDTDDYCRYQNIGKPAQNLASIMTSSKTKPSAPEYDIPAAEKGPSARDTDDYCSYTNLRDQALEVGKEFQDAGSDNEDKSSIPESRSTRPQSYRIQIFQSKHKCYDLAFLPRGTIALALKTEGMREYDTSIFCQRSSWEPERCGLVRRLDSVGTIEALTDERLVAGMLWTQNLVVLRRDPDRPSFWRIDVHIDVSPTTPYRISTWGPDLIVCTGNQVARGNCHPGRHLSIYSTKHPRKYLIAKMLEFWIYSVAITDEFVMATSCFKQRLHGMAKKYLFQAFTHAGIEVWHFESEDRVCDVTYSTSCDWFYLVHHSRQRIRTMRKAKSSANPEECDAEIDFSGSKFKPMAASADRNGRTLAVLSDYCEEIAICLPITSSATS